MPAKPWRAELLRHSPYYFFFVILIRHETTAAARWALLLIVRTFFNDAFAVALWASFHTGLVVALTVIFSTRAGTRRSRRYA